MTTSTEQLETILEEARDRAFPLVKIRFEKTLPKGWRAVLAVGWGLTILNEAGKCVNNSFSDQKLPARLRSAVEFAERFEELFGFDNEEIKSVE